MDRDVGRVDALLREHDRLREEIDKRTSAQTTFININVTAAGTLATIAYGSGKSDLLLLVPVLSVALGSTWLAYDWAIRSIAQYIRTDLRPMLVEILADTRLLGWEERRQRLSVGGSLIFGFSWILIFVLPPSLRSR